MTKKINIPKPCAEDWNNMKPTERGAFCDKCQIDVIDFNQMEPEEIRAVLQQRSGQRTCANISTTQMDLVNTNYHIWETQTPTVFRSKFLYACLMVFGVGLFAGCGVAEEEPEKVGDVEQIEVEETDNQTSSCNKSEGGYILSTHLGQLHESEKEIHYNNYDAFGNYSVTTRMKNKLID